MQEQKNTDSHSKGGRPRVENPRRIRSFKATDEEWSAIKRAAKKRELTASEYIRIRTLGRA